MADAPAAPVESVAEKMELRADLLQILVAGDARHLQKVLNPNGQTNGHVAVSVQATEAPNAAAVAPGPGTSSCCLLGMRRSNGNTALNFFSRGNVQATEALEGVAAAPGPGTSSSLPSVASNGSTALHPVLSTNVLATTAPLPGPAARSCLFGVTTNEMAYHILAWEATLLTIVDSSGRSPLHIAAKRDNHGVVALFLDVDCHVARIPDNRGQFPLHYAAARGCPGLINQLIEKCPDYHEFVDDNGMNLLHVAVDSGNNTVVRYICQNERFNMLWNAADFQGNTALHLAVEKNDPRIVRTLLHTKSVEVNMSNKNGLTAGDLAYTAYKSSPGYFQDPSLVVFLMLCWVRSDCNFGMIDVNEGDEESPDKEGSDEGYMKGNGTIASALIATVAFTAAFTVPGGFIADEKSQPGTAVLARRFAFRAFAASNTVAFLCAIVATCYIIYGGAREVPASHRRRYTAPASGLLPVAVQFMIAVFAFGFHLVLGAANRWLIIFVYFGSAASVLFCFPGIWVPFLRGYVTLLWRRGEWMELVFQVKRILFAVLICATFVVAIVLEISLPNY